MVIELRFLCSYLSISTRVTKIQKINAGGWKLWKWLAAQPSPSDFISCSPPPLFPAYSWEWSSANYQASNKSESNHWEMSICRFPCIVFSLLSVQTTSNYFLLHFSVTIYFFFTSFTINTSESHAGCFRYHTESTELSKVKVANTQCRKNITKYDFFSDKLFLTLWNEWTPVFILDKIFYA